MLSVQQCATLACLLDVTTPKPGNVHRGADFEDVTFLDFAKSAVAIGPVMEKARTLPLGMVVLHSIQETRKVTDTNTNLGIVLLFAPIAMAVQSETIWDGISDVLADLSPDDAVDVFEAIRFAQPGGLGTVDEMDVSCEIKPTDLLDAMRIAAHRDQIAQQYTDGFRLIKTLADEVSESCAVRGLTDGIIYSYLKTLSQFPDSLIARKCGYEVAREATQRAATVLNAGNVGSAAYLEAVADFDFWLRADGHRRNPGTTADMITAALFAALLQDRIQLR